MLSYQFLSLLTVCDVRVMLAIASLELRAYSILYLVHPWYHQACGRLVVKVSNTFREVMCLNSLVILVAWATNPFGERTK